MLMLDNGGNLNITNDIGQTPIAFANQNTLKRLDLEKAIATTTSSFSPTIKKFDNNKFLSKKQNEVIQTEEICDFQLEKINEPTNDIRVVTSSNSTYLMTFLGGKKKE